MAMQGKQQFILNITAIAAVILYTGCGKPPVMGGGEGEFPVQAVIAEAVMAPVQDTVSLVGSLQARDAVDLVSEIDAVIEDMSYDEGKAVAEGDTLFCLDEAKLQARLAESEARFRLAKTNFERNQALLDNQTISQQEFDQVQSTFEAAQAALDLSREEHADAVITAPFDGVTGERQVSRGQFVNRGTVLGSLVRTDPLEAVFDVPERYLSRLEPGGAIAIHSVAYRDETFAGTVFFVAPRVNERDRTVRVKAVVPNADGRLKPGMFGRLDLVLDTREQALQIPESCVQYRGDQVSVVVMDDDDRAAFRPVTLGVRFKGRVEVTAGLEAGERVVAEGHQKMGPGSLIAISPKSAVEQGPAE